MYEKGVLLLGAYAFLIGVFIGVLGRLLEY